MMERSRRLARFLSALIIATGMVATLAACGKKGELEPPPKKEETRKDVRR